MLRLLASLDHATLQASHSAHSALKLPELALRPSLQFLRVRPREFITVLWLEVEVVPDAQQIQSVVRDTARRAWRTAIPEAVQHAPNIGSQLYVCQTPLPSLPRSLPDLANYLQTLLRDSRRTNDSTTGLKRLAKLVDAIYGKPGPGEGGPGEEVGGMGEVGTGRKIGGLLSRVIPGRRERRNRNGEEDTYDLVTPFRLDT